MMRSSMCAAGAFILTLAASSAFAEGDYVQKDDLAFGLNTSDAAATSELVRGPASAGGGATVADAWSIGLAQSMEFDNLSGVLHNFRGNLLSASFDVGTGTGEIYSMATCDDSGATQTIGDTLGLGGAGLTATPLGGLSVSPDNTKIAVAGYVSRKVIVFDYTAGDCLGAGASLSGGRETDGTILCDQDTQGTTWLDDDTVLAFATTGEIIEIDATTMDATVVATVDPALGTSPCGPGFTDIEYNPNVSPYVYCMYSAFTGSTTNILFVLDPSDGYSEVAQIDYTGSMQTAREIALDSNGNLFVNQFSSAIDIVLDVVTDPASLVDNASIDWYTSPTFSSFSGIDIASATTGGTPCVADLVIDGIVGPADLAAVLGRWGAAPGNPADFDGDGAVGPADLAVVLGAWGPCP